jgi:hypothetical protein
MLVVLQVEMRQIPLTLILILPSPGLMKWEEEEKTVVVFPDGALHL